MSYILDALKKSDQQRRRGAAPTLLAPQAAPAAPTSRLSMLHVMLVAILIGAGIVIGALRPWQSSEPSPSPQAPATIVQTAAPPVVVATPESVASPSPAPIQPQPQLPTHSEPALPAQAFAPATPTAPAPPKQVAAITAPAPEARKPELAAAPAIQEQTVMTMAELPLAIQQEIPKMTITVHAYSRSSKERLLGINDRMLKEGDYLIPGLLLEQITPEGMIMNYKGYRFRHGVR